MSEERKLHIRQLREERSALNIKSNELTAEIARLDLMEEREAHPCICVKLNQDIEVYDMQEQERRKRVPLGLGMVSQTLSARRDCDYCQGTGKPTMHTCETYSPETCITCKLIP